MLALFCVAVGVMAVVALQLVGISVNQALIGNIVEANGGDVRVNADVTPLRQRDLSLFDQLKKDGKISDYATAYSAGGSIARVSGDAVSFSLLAVSNNYPLVGQPAFTMPGGSTSLQQVLQGQQVAISSKVYQDLNAHLGSTYQIKLFTGRLIPITVAAVFREEGAYRGPTVILSQQTFAAGSNQVLQQYSTVYMTVPVDNVNQVKSDLGRSLPGARVVTAQDLLKQREQQVEQIQLFLRIVGLLALFIGGVGIINTMQVLLRRRVVEIAMLKTTGYRRGDLYALFGLEAALLGIVGGIVGVAGGIGASYVVRSVMETAFFVHLPVVLDPLTLLSGLVIGLATALIFGLLPIIQASQVRPLTVLREGSEAGHTGSRLVIALLLVLLSLLFVLLAATILQDIVTAVIAVYGGAVIIFALALGLGVLVAAIAKLPVYDRPRLRMGLWVLAALGGIVAAILIFVLLSALGEGVNVLANRAGKGTLGIYALVVLGGLGIVLVGGALVFFLTTLLNSLVMFAPRSWKTPVMLAYRNMGRQRIRTTTTLTALFVGVFAIGLVLVLGQGIKDTISSTLNSLFTRNVFVVASPRQQDAVAGQVRIIKGVDTSKTLTNIVVPQVYPLFVGGRDLNTVLTSIHSGSSISKRDVTGALSSLEGYVLTPGKEQPPSIVLKDGRNLQAGDAGTNNVVVNAKLQAAPVSMHTGDSIIVQSASGAVTKELKVVGFYDASDPTKNQNFASILADEQVVRQLGGPSTIVVFSLKVDPDHLQTFKQQINKVVPGATIISVVDIDALINQVLNNLIIMLTTVASLAMIAGLIIIANAVALAMLERQREIGILKAVGYNSGSIMATVLIENGLVGGLGALVAMLLVSGAITALSKFVFQVPLSLGPWMMVLILGATALTTMLVSAIVSWRSVRVRPLNVLRYE